MRNLFLILLLAGFAKDAFAKESMILVLLQDYEAPMKVVKSYDEGVICNFEKCKYSSLTA